MDIGDYLAVHWRFIGGLFIYCFAFRISMVIFAGISVYFICISLITGITGARFFYAVAGGGRLV